MTLADLTKNEHFLAKHVYVENHRMKFNKTVWRLLNMFLKYIQRSDDHNGKKSDYILLSCFHIQLLKEPGVVRVKNTPKTITLIHIKPANCTPCSIKTIFTI